MPALAIILWAALLVLLFFVVLLWFATSGWYGAFRAGRRAHEAGRYRDAERHLLRALDLAESFALNDKKRLATLDLLGQVYLAQGKLNQAEALLKASLARL